MLAILPFLLAPSLRVSPAQTWAGPFCTGGELPAVGDADGDGRADCLAFGEGEGGSAFLQRTSKIGKAFPVAAMRGAGTGAAAVWGLKGGVAVLFRDGSLVRFAGVNHDVFTTRTPFGRIDAALIPPGSLRVAARTDGFHVVLVGPGGKALALQIGDKSEATPLVPLARPVADLGYALLGKTETLIWRTPDGEIQAAPIDWKGKPKLGPTRLLGKAEGRMAVGRFRGEADSDVIIGQTLWPAGDPKKSLLLGSLPSLAATDRAWLVGDIDGNGRDDLVRLTRTGRPWEGDDTVVHFSSLSTDPSPGYVSTSRDGLLDDWKEGRIAPGGIDVKALGAKVGRRELIVQFERRYDVSDATIQALVDRSRKFFADLPIANPDGSRGITLLAIVRPPTSPEEHARRMPRFDDYFPAPEHRGIVHTFYVDPAGPLVSGVWNNNGHISTNWATFPHEIGHNFGLAHEGWWGQDFNALYPSLMSYAYSYSVNDDGNAIRYSTGDLGGPYSERALPERMPFPLEKLRHLAHGPYRFRVKANGDQTLVDWNWNGIFDEKPVAGDITYSHGIRIGPRYDATRSWSGLALASVSGRLAIFYGLFPGGTAVPDPRAPNTQASLTRARPGALVMQSWQGDWSPPVIVEERTYWGAPSVATVGNRMVVAYPTSEGPTVRGMTVAPDGAAILEKRIALPRSATVVPTVAAVGDRFALLLWSGPQSPVTLSWLRPDGTVTPERDLPFRSRVAPAAVGGKPGTLWVSRIEDADALTKGRSELIGLDPETLAANSRSWIEGTYATVRPTLLWRDEPGLDAEGRIYHLSGGITTETKPWAEQYLTLQIAKPGSGWQYRRYYDVDFASREAPGACWFRDDMAYALRLSEPNPARNDVTSIGFYGTGASPEPLGDYNDVAHVRDLGLVRSILYAHR